MYALMGDVQPGGQNSAAPVMTLWLSPKRGLDITSAPGPWEAARPTDNRKDLILEHTRKE